MDHAFRSIGGVGADGLSPFMPSKVPLSLQTHPYMAAVSHFWTLDAIYGEAAARFWTLVCQKCVHLWWQRVSGLFIPETTRLIAGARSVSGRFTPETTPFLGAATPCRAAMLTSGSGRRGRAADGRRAKLPQSHPCPAPVHSTSFSEQSTAFPEQSTAFPVQSTSFPVQSTAFPV